MKLSVSGGKGGVLSNSVFLQALTMSGGGPSDPIKPVQDRAKKPVPKKR